MRQKLENRRHHEVFTFEHWGQKYHAGVGRDSRGEIREVWINAGKTGEQLETLARDSAVILSIALQNGSLLSDLRHSITRDRHGNPQGPIGALLDALT